MFSSDNDINKKPRAKKNINYVAGMVINTGDNEGYEHNDELKEGNVRKDDDMLGSNEEEEDGEEDEEEKEKEKEEKRDEDKEDEGMHGFDIVLDKSVVGWKGKTKVQAVMIMEMKVFRDK